MSITYINEYTLVQRRTPFPDSTWAHSFMLDSHQSPEYVTPTQDSGCVLMQEAFKEFQTGVATVAHAYSHLKLQQRSYSFVR